MLISSDVIDRALALIEEVEPCRLVAYLGDHGMPLLGYGLERYASGALVSLRDVTSPPIARAEMRSYLSDVILPLAERLPCWQWLGVRRRAALVCFMQGVGTVVEDDPRCAPLLEALKQGVVSPGALDAVPREMQRFVVDPLGKVKPALAERRKREAELWSSESSAMTRLRALQDTCLKRAPINAKYLSIQGVRPITKGEAIDFARLVEIPRDGHDWVILEGEKEQWAIFMPHWEQPDAPSATPVAGVDWGDFNAPLGKYLTVGEVLRYDARRRPRSGSADEKNLVLLAAEFDAIRAAWGGAIAVTSGYRPEPINTEVGGVPGSRHITGQALDVYPVNGDLEGFYRWIRRRWSGGLGDGRNRGFVHLDMRDNGRFHPRGGVEPAVTWLY